MPDDARSDTGGENAMGALPRYALDGPVRCTDCDAVFDDEDDLQQIQPDGRLACPLHDVGSGEGTVLVDVEGVAPAPFEDEVRALRTVVRELVRNDGLYGGAPGWQEGSAADQAFKRAMEERE